MHNIIRAEMEDQPTSAESSDPWFFDEYEEGQLMLDVYQTPNELVVISTIAGAGPDDIEILLDNDLLTIRGQREQPIEPTDADYLYRECYWGRFSRSLIIPVEVRADKIKATINNGVLKIILPKIKSSKQVLVEVKKE